MQLSYFSAVTNDTQWREGRWQLESIQQTPEAPGFTAGNQDPIPLA